MNKKLKAKKYRDRERRKQIRKIKTGIIITTHKKNYEKVKRCMKSIIRYAPKNRYIILFDNEGCDKNTENIPNIYTEIKYIHVKNQSEGLTYTWNRGIDICFENNCDIVILLNHDTEVNETFKFFIEAIARKDEIGIYGCTTNNAPFGNHLNQQSYIKSNTLIVDKIKKDPHGPGGFCLGFSREMLLDNKYDNNNYFDPSYPWGGNETVFNKRWNKKEGNSYIVRNCFVKHSGDKSWLKCKDRYGKNK